MKFDYSLRWLQCNWDGLEDNEKDGLRDIVHGWAVCNIAQMFNYMDMWR